MTKAEAGMKRWGAPIFYSHRRSAPSYGFGTSSSSALLPLAPSTAPGPGQYALPAVPSEKNSPHKAYLLWSRMPEPQPAQPGFLAPPGPTRYTTCTSSMLGKALPVATLASPPRYSWSRASTREARESVYVSREHERVAYGSQSPGPHTVGREAFSSMGRQASSSKRTNPRFAQVKERRFVTISDKHPRPGPGSYDP